MTFAAKVRGCLHPVKVTEQSVSKVAIDVGFKCQCVTLPRITARVDVDTQELLTQATAIAGMTSINSFVLSAAIEKAKQIIEREQTLKLSQDDASLLMEA